MTRNQQQAVSLARRISSGSLDPADLSDAEWNLLLLAGDLNSATSLPMLVCGRVLNRAERRIGYFSDTRRAAPRVNDLLASRRPAHGAATASG